MARKAAAAWASSDTWATPRNFVAAAGYAAGGRGYPDVALSGFGYEVSI